MPFLDRTTRTNRFLMCAVDSGLVYLSALLSWRVIFGGFNGTYMTTAIAITLLIQGATLFGAVYMIRAWTRWQLMYEGTKILGASALLLVPLRCLMPDVSFHAGLLTLLFAGFALVGWRLAFFEAFRKAVTMRLAVTDDVAQELMRVSGSNVSRKNGLEIVGIVGPAATPAGTESDGPWALLNLDAAPQVDAVIVGAQHAEMGTVLPAGMPTLPFVAAYENLSARIPVDHIDETWFVRSDALEQRFAFRIGKRVLDCVVAFFGLCFTALILPFVALAIKLADPGPIFYSQARVGRLGKEFRMYKFRTMRVDAEKDGAVWAAVNDQRVTKVGAFLRQTRLDELPQFWNVLKGEMSLVGPRPERPEFVSMLSQAIPFYDRRHAVLPGVTGWAQVMFPYGASVEDAKEKLQYDFYYVNNRSFYLDLKILFRTAFVMLRKFGGR
ncbi:MAG TPA: sugar transferase [Oscillatoriaceae cyanobacterium]